MQVDAEDGIVSFGKAFLDRKEDFQPEFQVYTKEILSQTFPFEIIINLNSAAVQKIKRNSLNQSQKLTFHYCNSLHKKISQEELNKLQTLENFNDDERVFFVEDVDIKEEK